MEDINLHFTGDIHAITTANNLLSAIIDNHIWQGNELEIEKVTWKRCVDLNDRALRKVQISLSGEKNMTPREDGFDITVASEIMAILCLAKDMKDLKRRLGNIIIGYNKQNNPITCKDLKAEGSLAVVLKDAINPNLVQTLENNPVLIHGGPFANIAHGCNSVIATNMALKMGDYVITEAGFGADLGAEKFLDIKCRLIDKKPNAVVIVATLKALKYHGGVGKEECTKENIEALKIGINNLLKHIENIKKYGVTPIVAINKFTNDTEKEITVLKEALRGIAEVSLLENWEKGGEGATDLANKLIKICETENDFEYIYNINDTIEEKIAKVSQKIYGATGVEYSDLAKEQLKELNNLKIPICVAKNINDTIEEKIAKVSQKIYGATGVEYSDLAKEQLKELNNLKIPICVAKTQYSFSDDPKDLLGDKPFNLHVTELKMKAGAEFVVVLTGKIMTMPGLPKKPAAENISIDDNGIITGIF